MILGGMILRSPEGDGTGAGGGGGGGKAPDGQKTTEGNAPAGQSITLSKEQFDALMARLPKAGDGQANGSGDGQNGEGDLADKARKKREDDEKRVADTKSVEQALKFNLSGKEWAKTHEALLPKNIASIFEQAEKEQYDTAVEKANAIKAGVVSEFFALQANLDLLTAAQKSALDDFQKLTKTGKQERVKQVYEMVFEPAFETLKRVKKAEQLQSGFGSPSDAEAAYKKKLMDGSRKHYLGEK